jgi:DNA-directed RNA polymerase specialized sigma24 family protein
MEGGSTVPDELDFDEFYTAGFRRIVSQIYAMTGNLAEAEDAVQEAYARAWQRWDQVCGYGDPEAWIRTVAYRLCVSSWRKAVNHRAAHRRAAASPELPGLSPDHLTLVAALRRISPEQRRAIVLFHLNRGRKALAPLVSEFAEVGTGGPQRPGTDLVGEW